MIPNNYQCDGQLNLWEYLSSTTICEYSGHTCNKKELWKVADSLDELQCPHVCCRKCNTRMCGARCNGSEEPKHQDPDDSICEGCKWREHKNRWLEVDEYGQTWVHGCPGTACANWTGGTALNLTAEKPSKEEVVWYLPEPKIYCFNRDFLLPLDKTMEKIIEWTGLKFTTYEADWMPEGSNKTVYKHIFKDRSYLEIDEKVYLGTDKTFISVSWEGKGEGTGTPCDNFDEVLSAVNSAIKRAKK